MSALHGLGILTREAVLDAVRRRIVAAVAVLSVLSLMVVDSCSSCSQPTLTVNDQVRELVDVAGYSATAMVTLLGLWVVTLAGVLAADHLTQTLEDGSAPLVLTRPVSREVFALSRLLGTLAVTGVAGAVLLGGTAFLFTTRSPLPLTPMAFAGLACLLGSLAVAALAMTVSLFVPRLASWLFAVALVGLVALAGGISAAPVETGGWIAWLAAYGPPLASSITAALGPWMPGIELPFGPLELMPRLLLWDALSVAADLFYD